MKTRILAFFLTLCMILSMVPVVAFAEEAPAPSMDAIKFNSSFEEDATIKLDQDLTVALTTAVTGKVTIDLNGKTLSGTIVGTKDLTIEIVDSSYPAEGATLGTFNVAVTNATVLMTEGKVGEAVGAYDVNTESEDNAKVVTYTGKIWSIGTVYYATLAKALEVAAKGAIITYCTPKFAVDVTAVPTVEGGLTIDLKGATANLVEIGNVTIANAVYTAMNVVGDVVLVGCSSTGVGAVTISDGKKLTVKDGTHADWLTDEYTTNSYAGKVVLPANAVVIGNTVVVPVKGDKSGPIVAVIGADGYDDLNDAIVAWNKLDAEGQKKYIDLIADVEGLVEVAKGVSAKINLGAHYVNATFINEGELTVKGTGTIEAITNKGTLTLESGVINSLTNKGHLVMNGGTLKSFGTGSDGTSKVYGGYVDKDIYAQVTVDAGSVGYEDGDYYRVEAAPAVIKKNGVSHAGYKSFTDALAAAVDGDTIVLNEDATYAGKISIEKKLTFDLNGNTLNAASIWIDETTAEKDANIGNLTITSSKDGGKVICSGTAVVTNNNAVLTLDGGVELSTSHTASCAIYMFDGTVNVNHATVHHDNNTAEAAAILVKEGTLNVGCGEDGCDNSCVTIRSNFTAISCSPDGNDVENTPEVNISCGTIDGGSDQALWMTVGSSAKISGGNFSSDGHVIFLAFYPDPEDATKAARDAEGKIIVPTISITGGEFTIPAGRSLIFNEADYCYGRGEYGITDEDNTDELYDGCITGGTFNGVTTANYAEFVEYLADSVAPSKDFVFNGALNVTKDPYVIAVNGVKYTNWQNAIDAVNAIAMGDNSKTVITPVTKDVVVDLDKVTGVPTQIILDLNGEAVNTITLKNAKNTTLLIRSTKTGASITGTINVLACKVNLFATNVYLNVDVEGALFNIGEGATGVSSVVKGSTATISCGKIAEGDAAKVALYGGTYKFNPTYEYVPADYIITEKDGVYTISQSDQIVAEIVTLGGAVIEKFTTVGAAVDYYLEKCVTNENPPYIKLYKNALNDNPKAYDFEAKDASKYYGVSIFVDVSNVTIDENVKDVTLDFHNDTDYVTLAGSRFNMIGIADLQVYSFADTVAEAGGKYYATVEAAVAVNAGVVTVLDDGLSFTVSANAKIDLNKTTGHVITVVDGAELTLSKGTVKELNANGGTTKLDGVTVTAVNVAAEAALNVATNSVVGTLNLAAGKDAKVTLATCKIMDITNIDLLKTFVTSGRTLVLVKDEDTEYASVVLSKNLTFMIGDYDYATLEDAIADYEAGDVIVVKKADVVDSAELSNYQTVVIDYSEVEFTGTITITASQFNAEDEVSGKWTVKESTVDDVTTYTSARYVATFNSVKYFTIEDAVEAKNNSTSTKAIWIYDITDLEDVVTIDTNKLYLKNAKSYGDVKSIVVEAGMTVMTVPGENSNVTLVIDKFTEESPIVFEEAPVDYDFTEASGYTLENTCFVLQGGEYVLTNAEVTGYDENGNGKGYENLYEALCDANVVEIKLLADITTDFVVALNNITIDLAGYTWTLANVSGGDPADPAITVTNAVTIKNGKIALDDSKGNDNYVLIEVVDGGDLTVEGLTIPKAFGYDEETGKNISIFLSATTDAEIPTTLYADADTTIAGLVVCENSDVAKAIITNLAKATIEGLYTCAIHEAADEDGCANCGLAAYSITLADGVILNTDLVEGEDYTVVNGVYWFYAGADVTFSKADDVKTPFGKYFAGFDVVTDANYNYEVTAENVTVAIKWLDQDTSNITVNVAGNYTVAVEGAMDATPFTGIQPFAFPQGSVVTVTYGDANANVIWVNASNKIVAVGTTIEYTVSAANDTLIAHEIGANTIVILNGELKLGSTVLSIGTYTRFYAWPELPTTIGVKSVTAWAVDGEGEYKTLDDLKTAINGTGAVVTPVFGATEGEINYVVNGGEATKLTVNVNGITRVTAPVVDGKHFSKWVVYDKNGDPVYTTTAATIAYAFTADMTLEAVYDVEATEVPEGKVTLVGTKDGNNKLTLVAHAVVPSGSMISVGIMYSTDGGETWKTSEVNNLTGLTDATATKVLNKTSDGEITVQVKAVVTFVDENDQVVTEVSKVENYTIGTNPNP